MFYILQMRELVAKVRYLLLSLLLLCSFLFAPCPGRRPPDSPTHPRPPAAPAPCIICIALPPADGR
jgi:hypothetical protein